MSPLRKLGILAIVLFAVSIMSHLVAVLNKDYETPIVDVNTKPKPSNNPPNLESSSETTYANGTKHYTVDLALNIATNFELGGSYFDSRKYYVYTVTTQVENGSFDVLKELGEYVSNIRDEYGQIVLELLAMTAIFPILLLKRRH